MKPPAPTRPTLIFPAEDRAREVTTREEPPASPRARPSERPTAPGVHGLDRHSARLRDDAILELSASLLESDDISEAAPSVPSSLAIDSSPALRLSRAKSDAPPSEGLRASLEDAMDAMRAMPRGLLAGVALRSLLGSAAAGALAIALVAGVVGPSDGARGAWSGSERGRAASRAPRGAAPELTLLGARASEVVAPPPAGGCAVSGPPRMLASRAHLPTGIDVSAFESGFGIAFASGPSQAVGILVDGALAREADRVRVRTAGTTVRHVVVDAAREDGDGELDVRIDGDDARTVVAEGEPGVVRLRVVGDRLFVAAAGKERGTWIVPGGVSSPPPAAAPTARGPRPRAITLVAPPIDLRAAPRDGGGVVVVARRGSAMWVGLLDHELVPEGPLVGLVRTGVTTGMPAVTAWGGGAAVAWAERTIGEKDWSVVTAAIGGPDDQARTVRTIGAGMSPSLAALPDGDLLLAYAEGGAGAHRVVARKLGRDHELAPHGEAVVVSPPELNAGQPAAVVAGDGRGLVAFFAAGAGHATVVARPIACDPGL